MKCTNRGIISGSVRIVSGFSDSPCFWDGFLLESGSGKVNVKAFCRFVIVMFETLLKDQFRIFQDCEGIFRRDLEGFLPDF